MVNGFNNTTYNIDSKALKEISSKLDYLGTIALEMHDLNHNLSLLLKAIMGEEPEKKVEETSEGSLSFNLLQEYGEIHNRTGNALRRAGAKCLRDLEYISERELKGVHNLGKGSIEEIKKVCEKHGIVIGRNVDYRYEFKKDDRIVYEKGIAGDLISMDEESVVLVVEDVDVSYPGRYTNFRFPNISCHELLKPERKYPYISLGMVRKES